MRKDCACPKARHRHGTRAAYTRDGCRCPDCTAANARVCKAWKLRQLRGQHLNRLPTARATMLRLQALTCLGYSPKALAQLTGIDARRLADKRNGKQDYVWPATETTIRDLYERLWDKPAPPGRSAAHTRALARRRGWLPPMALDDDTLDTLPVEDYTETPLIDPVAVDEAVAGRPVKLTKQERAEAISRLIQRGYSARQAAERLRISGRTVQRHSSKAA